VPTYQYTCTKCGHDLEARQSFSDAALTDCPTCGTGDALRKQFGSVGVVFKGSGFYRTDSRSESSKTASKDTSTKKAEDKKSDSTSKSDSGASSTTKSEPKKADKPKATASTGS
jgi:putative FmdB family regulatory protein